MMYQLPDSLQARDAGYPGGASYNHARDRQAKLGTCTLDSNQPGLESRLKIVPPPLQPSHSLAYRIFPHRAPIVASSSMSAPGRSSRNKSTSELGGGSIGGKPGLLKVDFVKYTGWLVALLMFGAPLSPARSSTLQFKGNIDKINRHLAGQVLDFTDNHGEDRRIWSEALGERRDLYVYVPPGYDCHHRYPIILWLHGFAADETSFIKEVVQLFDAAIVAGTLPPAIVAAPDGSIKGRPSFRNAGSFYLNSKAGNFEDYIIHDVWGFLLQNFPIRPEREAHAITGVSMGGFGAYNLAFKYPQIFKVVAGFLPPLNPRWVDCHGRYMRNFDPCCWGWRSELRGWEVIGRFYGGLIVIRQKRLIDPLFGLGPPALAALSRENPIEMIDRFHIPNGLYDLCVAYGGKDQFNIDAQVESFLYLARQRGLCVSVNYDPRGRHNLRTMKRLAPWVLEWLGRRLGPFGPVPVSVPECKSESAVPEHGPNSLGPPSPP